MQRYFADVHKLTLVSLLDLTDSAGRVLDQYRLDGVHLAPAAVHAIEVALGGHPG